MLTCKTSKAEGSTHDFDKFKGKASWLFCVVNCGQPPSTISFFPSPFRCHYIPLSCEHFLLIQTDILMDIQPAIAIIGDQFAKPLDPASIYLMFWRGGLTAPLFDRIQSLFSKHAIHSPSRAEKWACLPSRHSRYEAWPLPFLLSHFVKS